MLTDIPMPVAVAALPRDVRGYPIPWLVAEIDGKRDDLRIACSRKRLLAFEQNLCWVCGQSLGNLRVFIGGPLSCVNRVFGDWCMHEECALYSLAACPFLNGEMVRRPAKDHKEAEPLPSAQELRPPLAGAYYTSRPTEMSKEGHFLAGAPRYVWWFKDGVRVSQQEALPILDVYLAEMRKKGLVR